MNNVNMISLSPRHCRTGNGAAFQLAGLSVMAMPPNCVSIAAREPSETSTDGTFRIGRTIAEVS